MISWTPYNFSVEFPLCKGLLKTSKITLGTLSILPLYEDSYLYRFMSKG